MHISKNEIPVKVKAPGATAQQKTDFGDATPYGMIGAEYFTMAAGTDIAPLLQGLENNHCQAPHWGYIIKGDLTVTYQSGDAEKDNVIIEQGQPIQDPVLNDFSCLLYESLSYLAVEDISTWRVSFSQNSAS